MRYFLEFVTWLCEQLVVFGAALSGAGFCAIGAMGQGVGGDIFKQAAPEGVARGRA